LSLYEVYNILNRPETRDRVNLELQKNKVKFKNKKKITKTVKTGDLNEIFNI